ncbi:MAG: DNA-processing protein DprA, partial [Bacteroidales bacterium]
MQIHEIALNLCHGIGAQTAKKLLNEIGEAEAIFAESKEAIQKIKGIATGVWGFLHAQSTFQLAEKELAIMNENGIESIFYTAANFPQRLKECNDSPILLFKKGTMDLNMPKTIAIVGTRRASRYGIEQTHQLIGELQHDGVTILSGLAYGIDTQAHLSALDYHLPTACILGHGFDHIYPPENTNLAHRILEEEGAWISEYPWHTPVLPGLFPRRNRIVAGLSDAVVVIEASNKGGALITARIANSYNRDVFAIPGRNNEYYSQGCNSLIKQNQAVLLQNANDIRDYMQWELYQTPNNSKKRNL